MLRGGKISEDKPIDVGKAIIGFQYVERIKSELIIAAKLLEFIMDLKGDEQNGANKLLKWYLEALLGEINMAYNIVGRQEFLQASEKLTAAVERIQNGGFDDAIRDVAEAISSVAGGGQWAMQILKDKGFFQ